MEIDYLSRPIYIFIPSGGFSSLFSFLFFIIIRNETEETLLLSYDFLMPTFLFIREGPYSRKITFSRGETSINFAVLLISRGRTPREKFQDSVARRLRAEWGARAAVPPLFCFH